MDNKKKILLDDKFIQWRLFQTEELDAYWEEFRKKNPHLNNELDQAIEEFKAVRINDIKVESTEKEAVYITILNKVEQENKKKRKRVWLQTFTSAAAIITIVVASTLFFNLLNPSKDRSIVNDSITGQTLPAEDILIISGDSKINLANNANIELTDKKAVVTDSTENKQELNLAKTTINTLIVPYGKRSSLILADGSRVCVNSGSHINFPTEFKGRTREIEVIGEAYLEIAENKAKPFIVKTRDIDIQVYGTSFNVSAYENDLAQHVVLVEGKVELQSGDLRTCMQPNEKVELLDGVFTKQTVDVNEYISWTKDVLIFNETPITEILKKISRYYNVEFENSTNVNLNEKTCTGKLFLSSDLDSVMTSITHITSTTYNRRNNIININAK